MPFRKSCTSFAVGAVLLLLALAAPVSAQCPRWRRVDVGQVTNPMQAVYAYDSLHIWASTFFGDVIFSKDGGHSWSSFTLGNVCCPGLEGGSIANSFFFFDTLNGWVAGEAYNYPPPAGSFRIHTTDGGATWVTQLDTGINWGVQILFLNRHKGFDLIGHDCNFRDSFLVSNDSGKTWPIRATRVPACDLGRLQFVDSLNGWVISYRPVPNNNAIDLLRTRDGGNSWVDLPVSIPLCAGAKIWFQDTLNGWMWHCDPNVSNRYRFSRTNDGGITWDSLYTFNGDIWFYTFKVVDTAHFWLAGINYSAGGASVQFSTDGGRSWTEQMPGVGDDIVGLDAADGNHAYAVGNSGYLYTYSPAPLNGLIGDVNQDSLLTAADVVLLLNRTFLGAPVCVPMSYIDFNNDCTVSPADVVLLLNKVFLGGPPFQPGCAGP